MMMMMIIMMKSIEERKSRFKKKNIYDLPENRLQTAR